MNILMHAIMPTLAPGASVGTKSQARIDPGTSFSKYVERNMAAERRKNLLGDRSRKIAEENQRRREKDAAKRRTEADAAAEVLQRLMQRLQGMANQADAGPGDWALNVPDTGTLSQIGAAAGMSESDLALLLEQQRLRGGTLNLDDFLNTFARHFKELGAEKPVTVPETDLPLLESFLSQMGGSMEQIRSLSDQAVTGDGRLDLAKFLEGLAGVDAQGQAALSEWDAEQLRNILNRAGVSEQNALFWDKKNDSLLLNLERLQEMIEESLADIEAGRPQADVAGFLDELETILAQSGFEDKTVGWSPAVQRSIVAAYQELLESVNLAMAYPDGAGPGLTAADGPGASAPAARLAPEPQQQAFEQISMGVMRGLKNNEHHLILKLYPRELGEVKVELLVQEERLSVSFAMENNKVKEVLESNMEQFKESLAEKGFTLEQCMVSVEQRETPEDWQRFGLTWDNPQESANESPADLPDDALYHRSYVFDERDGRINLFI